MAAPKPAPPPPRTKPAGRKKAAAARPAAPEPTPPAPERVAVDPAWPLPVPDYLVPLLKPRGSYDRGPRPHLGVLIEIAIAAGRPDEVLHWFDRMRAAERGDRGHSSSSAYADRVAAAVAKSHPERAIEVYRVGLEAHLPNPTQGAYETSSGYLRKLRPLYDALDRTGEWTALVASVRDKYKNRPKFLQLLDALDGRTIVQTVRKPKT